MGDTEQVQMDSTPIFPAVRRPGPAPTVRRRRQAATAASNEENAAGEQGEEGVPVKTGMPTYVRVLLLLSLIPVMYYVPKVLSMAGEKVQKNQHLLIYLWSVSFVFYFSFPHLLFSLFLSFSIFYFSCSFSFIFFSPLFLFILFFRYIPLFWKRKLIYLGIWCSFIINFLFYQKKNHYTGQFCNTNYGLACIFIYVICFVNLCYQ